MKIRVELLMRYWLIALLALSSVACADDHPLWSDPTQIEFDPALEVDLALMTKTASGLYIRDLAVGDGAAAAAGDSVVVHYTGWLPSGFEFDSSRTREPFGFRLGVSHVILGWHEGIEGMRIGGIRQLVIPPSLAYPNGSPDGTIPPDATIVFVVELLEIVEEPAGEGAS